MVKTTASFFAGEKMQDQVEKITSLDRDLDTEKLKAGKRHGIHLVLDNIRSAFNVGSIFRTADAACVQKIHLCGISAYPPNAKLQKTALGSTETVPWKYYETTLDAIKELKAKKIPICLVELTTKSINLWDYKFEEPVALVFGHEVYGISEDVFDLADHFVSIPMYGKKTTLNVSNALSIVLFEALRQIV